MCSGNCADLPTAPAISPRPNSVIAVWPISRPLNANIPASAPLSASALIEAISSVPVLLKIRIIAASIPRSPSRVTRNAFFAAAAAAGRWNQNPISRYEVRPTSSQKANSISRLSARTSPSIEVVNSAMKAK